MIILIRSNCLCGVERCTGIKKRSWFIKAKNTNWHVTIDSQGVWIWLHLIMWVWLNYKSVTSSNLVFTLPHMRSVNDTPAMYFSSISAAINPMRSNDQQPFWYLTFESAHSIPICIVLDEIRSGSVKIVCHTQKHKIGIEFWLFMRKWYSQEKNRVWTNITFTILTRPFWRPAVVGCKSIPDQTRKFRQIYKNYHGVPACKNSKFSHTWK
jgi:hypothetical protein